MRNFTRKVPPGEIPHFFMIPYLDVLAPRRREGLTLCSRKRGLKPPQDYKVIRVPSVLFFS